MAEVIFKIGQGYPINFGELIFGQAVFARIAQAKSQDVVGPSIALLQEER
nr:hypothetical protein Itr_chr15CG12090 [Ipomoea trifida]